MPSADPQDPVWLQWRADKHNTLLAERHKAVKEQRPGAQLSLSPNSHDFAYERELHHNMLGNVEHQGARIGEG